jgi:hypothetical protein
MHVLHDYVHFVYLHTLKPILGECISNEETE